VYINLEALHGWANEGWCYISWHYITWTILIYYVLSKVCNWTYLTLCASETLYSISRNKCFSDLHGCSFSVCYQGLECNSILLVCRDMRFICIPWRSIAIRVLSAVEVCFGSSYHSFSNLYLVRDNTLCWW
jgi:hypothetical protein